MKYKNLLYLTASAVIVTLSSIALTAAFTGPDLGQDPTNPTDPGGFFGVKNVETSPGSGIFERRVGVDTGGNPLVERFQITGNVKADGFIGAFLGTVDAAQVTTGIFGDEGVGNIADFAFPQSLAIGTNDATGLTPNTLSVNGNIELVNAQDRGEISTMGFSKEWTESIADFDPGDFTMGAGLENPTMNDELTLSGAGGAANWFNGSWQYRKTITIDSSDTAKVSGNLSSFPVLVKLTPTEVDFGKIEPGGRDIRFTSTIGTPAPDGYNFEIEFWDDTAEEAYVWVKIPSITSGTDTQLHIYYGSSGAVDTTTIANFTEGTWDASYMMVQHLEETSGTHEDSTSNNNDSTSIIVTSQNAAGQIDGADDFSGGSDAVVTTDIDTDERVTVETWVYPNGSQVGNLRMVEKLFSNAWYLGNDGTNQALAIVNNIWVTGSAPYTPNQWSHIAFTFDKDAPSNQIKLYVNGVEKNVGTHTTAMVGNDIKTTIGKYSNGGGFAFNGRIDEVRISDTARNADWMMASYHSGNDTLVSSVANEELGATYNTGAQTWESAAEDAGGGTYQPTEFTATWQLNGGDNTVSFQIWGSDVSDFSTKTTYTTAGIVSGVPHTITIPTVPTPARYWKVVATLNTGVVDTDTPQVFNMRLSEGDQALVLQAGGQNVGIGVVSPISRLDVNGALKLADEGTRPVCDATNRGMMWIDFESGATADTFEACTWDGAVYGWRNMLQ
jgi:hypothetical protein